MGGAHCSGVCGDCCSDFCNLFAINKRRRLTVMCFGFPSAGKTTLVTKAVRTFGAQPTSIGNTSANFTVETFPIGKRSVVECFDIAGGDESTRQLWPTYFRFSTDGFGLMYVIDATQDDQLIESSVQVLLALLEDDAVIRPRCAEHTPVAIVINKCDLVAEDPRFSGDRQRAGRFATAFCTKHRLQSRILQVVKRKIAATLLQAKQQQRSSVEPNDVERRNLAADEELQEVPSMSNSPTLPDPPTISGFSAAAAVAAAVAAANDDVEPTAESPREDDHDLQDQDEKLTHHLSFRWQVFEVSSKTGSQVEAVFNWLATAILRGEAP